MKRHQKLPIFRFGLVVMLLATTSLALLVRAVYLQVWHAGYLQKQGNARHLRIVSDAPHRGMILDRNGEPLAISTPVESVWAQPEVLLEARSRWPELSRALGISTRELVQIVKRHQGREFLRNHKKHNRAEQYRSSGDRQRSESRKNP